MRSSPARRRKAARRFGRRVVYWFAGPVSAGIALAVASLLGTEVTGPARCVTTSLSLIPAALVHCHSRDRDLTYPQTFAVGLAAAVVAYAVIVIGLFTGAAATLALYLAVQTGLLAVASQMSGPMGLLLALSARRRTA
jgi:hypothetical protein